MWGSKHLGCPSCGSLPLPGTSGSSSFRCGSWFLGQRVRWPKACRSASNIVLMIMIPYIIWETIKIWDMSERFFTFFFLFKYIFKLLTRSKTTSHVWFFHLSWHLLKKPPGLHQFFASLLSADHGPSQMHHGLVRRRLVSLTWTAEVSPRS